jgi:hypothetical protein
VGGGKKKRAKNLKEGSFVKLQLNLAIAKLTGD